MPRLVPVDPHYHLWVEDRGEQPETSPILLIMGANASGVVWPDALVDRLAERHRGGARKVVIEGMGHALSASVLEPLAQAVLAHCRSAEGVTTQPAR